MTIMNLIRNEEGATALEYGLLAALIAAAISGSVIALGDQVTATFNDVATKMETAMASGS